MDKVYVVTTIDTAQHGKHPIVKVFSNKEKADKWVVFMKELLWKVSIQLCEVDDWQE